VAYDTEELVRNSDFLQYDLIVRAILPSCRDHGRELLKMANETSGLCVEQVFDWIDVIDGI
jgi:hypothetical protein